MRQRTRLAHLAASRSGLCEMTASSSNSTTRRRPRAGARRIRDDATTRRRAAVPARDDARRIRDDATTRRRAAVPARDDALQRRVLDDLAASRSISQWLVRDDCEFVRRLDDRRAVQAQLVLDALRDDARAASRSDLAASRSISQWLVRDDCEFVRRRAALRRACDLAANSQWLVRDTASSHHRPNTRWLCDAKYDACELAVQHCEIVQNRVSAKRCFMALQSHYSHRLASRSACIYINIHACCCDSQCSTASSCETLRRFQVGRGSR